MDTPIKMDDLGANPLFFWVSTHFQINIFQVRAVNLRGVYYYGIHVTWQFLRVGDQALRW